MPNSNSCATIAMAEEFARSGISDACLSPGSRSTAMVTGLLRTQTIRPWVILDERCAAFFALGMARETRRPVLLLCTSGTAAANYLPAVVEAALSNVPLVVVTSDRPPEARDCHSAQTIDQVRMFGSHARWSVDLATPHTADGLENYYRTMACRAVAVASRAPAGPVHLNLPMREPLIDVEAEAAALMPGGAPPAARLEPWTHMHPTRTLLADMTASRFGARLGRIERGIIICGPGTCISAGQARAVTALAQRLKWPLLADPLSGLRLGRHDRACVVDCYDVLLRAAEFVATHRPEAIVQFGQPPVSKSLAQFIQETPRGLHLMVAEPGTWPDPHHRITDLVNADVAECCVALLSAIETAPRLSAWLDAWLGAAGQVRVGLERMLALVSEMFEGKVITETIRLIPDGSCVHVGNSMPVRDFDSFVASSPRELTVCGNRGASGIDGVLSTALGAAAARSEPTVLLLGDLSCLHDIGAWQIAARYPIRLLVVAINNDGGGIFSFLPQAGLGNSFETFFATPHGLSLEQAAAMGHAGYAKALSWSEFGAAIRTALAGPGACLIEVPSDRARNVALHRRILQSALEDMRAGEAGPDR